MARFHWLLVPALAGCARGPIEAPPASGSANAESTGAEGTSDSAQDAPVHAGFHPVPVVPSGPSLPEIVVENVGLHIGGGANDDAGREPFKAAIRPHFSRFLRCYRLVEVPMKGGTFGVDLFIGREGGKPDVRQPRTGMAGPEFRRCMLDTFESIEFGRPERGPTVISYSLRFVVRDASKKR
jgi:hypothetical protein